MPIRYRRDRYWPSDEQQNHYTTPTTDQLEVAFNTGNDSTGEHFEEAVENALYSYTASQHCADWIDHCTPIDIMTAPTVEAWLYNELSDYFQIEAVAEMYAGQREGIDANGVAAYKQWLFEQTEQEIDDEIQRGGGGVAAFNNNTADWPHDLCAEFAAHEARVREGEYQEELEQFVESEGTGDMALEQTELTTYFEYNPFEDESLTDEEAQTVMCCRHFDADVSEIDFDAIDDHESFRNWVKEGESVTDAIRGHHFGVDVPNPVVAEAAPPDEWDQLPTEQLESVICNVCNDHLYRIIHHEQGEVWVTEDGEITSATDATDYSAGVTLIDQRDDRPYVCNGCESRIEAEASHQTAVIQDGVRVDMEVQGRYVVLESDGEPVSELLDEYSQMHTRSLGETNLVRLQPTNREGVTVSDQQVALDDLIQSDEPVFDTGEVIIERRSLSLNDEYGIYFPRDSIETAHRVKEGLEASAEERSREAFA